MDAPATQLIENPTGSFLHLVQLTRDGIAVDEAVEAMGFYQVPVDAFLGVLGISRRTWTRRTSQDKAVLSPVESDRLVRFLQLMRRADQVFDSHSDTVAWLHARNRALDGVAPLELLDTQVGTKQIEKILLRLEHGVYS